MVDGCWNVTKEFQLIMIVKMRVLMLFQNCTILFSYFVFNLDGIHYCNALQVTDHSLSKWVRFGIRVGGQYASCFVNFMVPEKWKGERVRAVLLFKRDNAIFPFFTHTHTKKKVSLFNSWQETNSTLLSPRKVRVYIFHKKQWPHEERFPPNDERAKIPAIIYFFLLLSRFVKWFLTFLFSSYFSCHTQGLSKM